MKRFGIRGFKGLWWDGLDNYRLAVPWMARHQLNFLMTCYSSFPESGARWREPFPPDTLDGLHKLSLDARNNGIHLCVALNPGIWSEPPLTYGDPSEAERIVKKIRQLHRVGIQWYGLCLDDINRSLGDADQRRFGSLGKAQAYWVNTIWQQVSHLSPRPRLLFCPSVYTTVDGHQHSDYLKEIRVISREIPFFWTGPTVCAAQIQRTDVIEWTRLTGRKPFIWDNYPVNDMFQFRPILGPLRRRGADLPLLTEGYMANPMRQWHLSTLPLATMAAYVNDPAQYEPERAIRHAITEWPQECCSALELAVESYGACFWGDPGFPQFQRWNGDNAPNRLRTLRALRARMHRLAPLSDFWNELQPTVNEEITALSSVVARRQSADMTTVYGDQITGGAADLYGALHWGELANLVYARSTGRHEMSATLQAPASGARALRIRGRNADIGPLPHISIRLGDHEIHHGQLPLPQDRYDAVTLPLPGRLTLKGAIPCMIRCEEPEGILGMPPWFMVSELQLLEH